MPKFNLTRVFDSGLAIQIFTRLGAGDLADFVNYLADFTNQIVAGVKGRLTVEDNLDSEIRTLDLKNGITQKIQLTDPKKTPKHVWVTKIIPLANAPLSFGWQMAQDGKLEVQATFTAAPTAAVSVTLMILF